MTTDKHFPDHILNCEGQCIVPSQSTADQTWMCDGQCQNWTTPCMGSCPYVGDSFNSAGAYFSLSGAESTCHVACHEDQLLCDGQCQIKSLQCRGNCLDPVYRAAECNGTCSAETTTWMCQDVCTSIAEPCLGRCLPGNYLIRPLSLWVVKYRSVTSFSHHPRYFI